MILLARKFPNVYIDTSAYKAKRYPRNLVEYMRANRHKVMFGSNYPMIMPGDCLADLDSLGLDDETRRLFFFGNAAKIFNIQPR